MKITYTMLQAAGACDSAVSQFFNRYGEEVEVTAELVKKDPWARKYADWAVMSLGTPEQQARYARLVGYHDMSHRGPCLRCLKGPKMAVRVLNNEPDPVEVG